MNFRPFASRSCGVRSTSIHFALLALIAAFWTCGSVTPAAAQFTCESSAGGNGGADATGGPENTAWGPNANATGTSVFTSGNTAVGSTANASGNESHNTAIGEAANGSGPSSANIAVGNTNNASGGGSGNIAIGQLSNS